jgi:hypothetical protein
MFTITEIGPTVRTETVLIKTWTSRKEKYIYKPAFLEEIIKPFKLDENDTAPHQLQMD